MLRVLEVAFARILAAAAVTLALAPALAGDAPTAAELLDRAAIQNLVVKYAIALDTLDADMYASVFAEDAEFTFGGNTYKGRAEIRKIVTGLQERNAKQPADAPKMYHALSNTYVEFVNDHEARHRSYWQTIRGPSSGPFTVGAMGRYEDTLVKRNGEWLIQKRQIVQ
ncbi:MAG TPA: nuclear transport factor 2 family protein [Gammaproteobacteria bacterium]|nr:nuclear transport factor 2 family protein [Gammaproteobacteria bacterium]